MRKNTRSCRLLRVCGNPWHCRFQNWQEHFGQSSLRSVWVRYVGCRSVAGPPYMFAWRWKGNPGTVGQVRRCWYGC
jgi:hypothetical protein